MHRVVVVLGGGQRTASSWREVVNLVIEQDFHADLVDGYQVNPTI